ncbi:serine-arginine protein 55-like [Diabrotica virgifera virgifera]|uniref:Serine-arginine protein 55-like n=1 Tax=Diabrotica virgifera virgifera TaxID=50390 RepID=A0A6P7H5M8_DIAVI|nr:serine-arginine protein 55-like [Diabrotica virgifera virgifera]
MVGSRVYVGGLPYGASERDLERFFRGYGRMRDVLIKNGYGFVEFDDYRDADDAVYELNGKKLLGERVTVERARGTPRGRDQYASGGSRSSRNNDDRRSSNNDRYGPPTRTNYRVLVENLSSRISWQDLKDYMRQAGEVTYADAHKQHRNEGVVEFASYSDMKNAIEKLDDTELNGRKLRLVEDKKNKSRRSASDSSRSRSRSRSRSARRSRSRSRSSRSKSKSKSRSRSRSLSNKDDREKSKSRSRSRSNSRKKSDRSRSNSRKKSVGSDHSRSRSRSRTPDKRSKSREASKERSRSRSRSRSESKERSKSRSRSRSPN